MLRCESTSTVVFLVVYVNYIYYIHQQASINNGRTDIKEIDSYLRVRKRIEAFFRKLDMFPYGSQNMSDSVDKATYNFANNSLAAVLQTILEKQSNFIGK